MEFAIDREHKPVDPVGMSRDFFLQNVAKVIHCTRRLSEEMRPIIPIENRITLIVPRFEDFVFSPEPGSFYVNSNFIKRTCKLDENIKIHLFEESSIEDRSILRIVNPKIRKYQARYEFSRPESTLNSSAWEQFVRKVASFGHTYVITEPLEAGGAHLWRAYLATHLADEVSYLHP